MIWHNSGTTQNKLLSELTTSCTKLGTRRQKIYCVVVFIMISRMVDNKKLIYTLYYLSFFLKLSAL